MRDGICPKCGSNEVYWVAQPHLGYGVNTFHIEASLFFPKKATLYNYACVQCGFVESYVLEPDKLAAIAQKWTKVQVG
jgi:uncharacterized OB-fold protein